MFLDKFIDVYKKEFNIETLGNGQDEMEVIIWALNTGQTLQISTSMYYVDDEEEEVSDGKGDVKVDVPSGKSRSETSSSDGKCDDECGVLDGKDNNVENVSDEEDIKTRMTKKSGHYEYYNYKEIPNALREAIDSTIMMIVNDTGQGGSACQIGVFKLRGQSYFIYTNAFSSFYSFDQWDENLRNMMTYEKYHDTMALSTLDITLTTIPPRCIDWTSYGFSEKYDLAAKLNKPLVDMV